MESRRADDGYDKRRRIIIIWLAVVVLCVGGALSMHLVIANAMLLYTFGCSSSSSIFASYASTISDDSRRFGMKRDGTCSANLVNASSFSDNDR